MTTLRWLKLAGLRMAASLGLTSWALHSRWRQERLLILCYHGISLEDEHEWNPSLYVAPALFRQRMDALHRMGCAVLGLGEALERLYSGRLPKKAVAITFDDGSYDFYRSAHPILREYGFPATVYLTTYYASYNRPVFDVVLSYLLWKGRNQALEWPELLERAAWLDERGRRAVQLRIRSRAQREGLSAKEKDGLLESLAGKLGVDYQGLCSKRMLHLMTLEEARELAEEGVDIQLHTHRHRLWRQRDLFTQEIEDNRRSISTISGKPLVHFCYPCGLHWPEVAEFLGACGIESATTCQPGLADRRTNRFFLPRFLDSSNVTVAEFMAWVSGLASFLPQRGNGSNESERSEYASAED